MDTIFILVLIFVQIAMFCIGVIQVMSDNPVVLFIGVFNIIANAVFGTINVLSLIK